MMNNTSIVNDSSVRAYQGVFGMDSTDMYFAFRGIDVKAKRIDSVTLFSDNAPHAESPIENIASEHEISRQNRANGTNNANDGVENFHFSPCAMMDGLDSPHCRTYRGPGEQIIDFSVVKGYSESLSISSGGQRPCQSGAFFMPVRRQTYPSRTGVETRHTTPARGNRDAVPLDRECARSPAQRWPLSQLVEAEMANQSIATSVASFSFEKFTVRAINRNGEIWFVAADVCAVLDIKNPRDAVSTLDDDEKDVGITDTLGGKQKSTIINESGLYALILRSRKPEAKRFRKWVTSEVLPSIRKTGAYSLTISKAQQGELSTLIAERFPSGKDRPYAWSRFNNHFRLASYKDLPTNRFEEACEYIGTMPEPVPALQRPAVNLLDKDYFAQVRNIANKFIDDWSRVHNGEDVHPTLTIPDDVLAGIVAQQLSRQNFRLYVDYSGRLMVDAIPNKSPYEGLAEAIEDKGNIGLPDETIREIGRACVNALAYRAQSRKAGGKK